MSRHAIHHNTDQHGSRTGEKHESEAGSTRQAPAVSARRGAHLGLHPSTALVPELSGAEYDALRGDIELRGIVVPIEASSTGVVLDGRGRVRAARDLALSEVPARVVDPADEVTYIVSAAIHRRHLSA